MSEILFSSVTYCDQLCVSNRIVKYGFYNIHNYSGSLYGDLISQIAPN